MRTLRKKYQEAVMNEQDLLAERELDHLAIKFRDKRIAQLEGHLTFAKKMFSVHGVDPAILDNYRPEVV